MVGRIVITNRRVITARAEVEVVVVRVTQQQPMNLERERIIFTSFENQLTEDTKLLGETRRYEQVKLAEGKCVCRTFLITRAEVHVGEPLNLQTGRAAWHLVVFAVIGGVTSRRAFRTRGNC